MEFILLCYPFPVYRYQTKAARDVLDTILSIQPKDSSGGSGETRESVVYRLSDDMLEKLPADYDPFEVSTRLHIELVEKIALPRFT